MNFVMIGEGAVINLDDMVSVHFYQPMDKTYWVADMQFKSSQSRLCVEISEDQKNKFWSILSDMAV